MMAEAEFLQEKKTTHPYGSSQRLFARGISGEHAEIVVGGGSFAIEGM